MKVQELAEIASVPAVTDDQAAEGLDTAAFLFTLVETNAWGKLGPDKLDGIMKAIEIRGMLHGRYDSRWRTAGAEVEPETLELALQVIARAFDIALAARDVPLAAKRLNALLKLSDRLARAGAASAGLRRVEQCVQQLAAAATASGPWPRELQMSEQSGSVPHSLLPITVLFWEGPIGRAYLATLRSLGLRPARIVKLVSARDLVSKQPVGTVLPASWRMRYADWKQRSSIHYWPRSLARTHQALVSEFKEKVEQRLCFSPATLEDAYALADLRRYSDDVREILVDGLSDKQLLETITGLPGDLVLFTGGGIVPRRLLQGCGKKFLHIHPGFLPNIRGADCIFWSYLLTGRPSASCFFLAPGIDDGDVIDCAFLPELGIRVPAEAIDAKTVYRMTYGFLDPWVRASVLRSALQRTNCMTQINATPQKHSESMTYHFMHPKLQEIAFLRMFSA